MTRTKNIATAAEVLRGIKASLPMTIGFVPIALILGATRAQTGMFAVGVGLMTAINFAGGSEFAALAQWLATPPILAIILTTWLINSRRIMLSAALTPYVTQLSLPKALAVFFIMCDETWALSMQDIDKRRKAGVPDAAAFSFPFYHTRRKTCSFRRRI